MVHTLPYPEAAVTSQSINNLKMAARVEQIIPRCQNTSEFIGYHTEKYRFRTEKKRQPMPNINEDISATRLSA